MRENGGRGATAPGTARSSLRPSFSSTSTDEFIDAHLLEHVFEPRLGAVGAIAVIDEHAHHRIGDQRRIRGPDDDAGVAREAAVARKSAEAKTEPDAGLKSEAVVHLHRLEADVVGILQHGNYARAVEADIELARQAVERAVVENMEVPFARIRPRVDQLLRIDTGGRRAGDVADIVGAGAARAQTEILHRLDHGDGILRFDFADLDIRARRDMRVAAAVSLGEVGESRKLRGLQNAVRQSQAGTYRNSGWARRRTARSSASGNYPAGFGYSFFAACAFSRS